MDPEIGMDPGAISPLPDGHAWADWVDSGTSKRLFSPTKTILLADVRQYDVQ